MPLSRTYHPKFPHHPLTCSLKFPNLASVTAELHGTTGKNLATSPFAEADWTRVGQTLRTLRELRGFSPAAFAEAIGVSRSYLANIEAGRKKLTNVLLARAAQALGVAQLAIMRPATNDAEQGAA